MAMSGNYPVILFAYDRLDYFQQVLDCLAGQDVAIAGAREVHLFQDGARCIFRDIDTTSAEKTEQSAALFKSYFPDGHVHYDGKNRNIALQWRRAEDYIFGERGFPAAHFLEDDTIIAPHYLRMLDHLTGLALAHGRVSYVSAFGDHTLSAEQQQAAAGAMGPMRHIWASAMMRDYWLKERPLLDGYYQLMSAHPYSGRPTTAILRALHQTVGFARGTAQDSAKETASVALGYARLTTRSCHAKYIGDRGSHFVPENYKAMKFDRTEMFGAPVLDISWPENDEIDKIIGSDRAGIESGSYRSSLIYPDYFEYLSETHFIALDDRYFLAVDPASGFVIVVGNQAAASRFSVVSWTEGDQKVVVIKDASGKFVSLCGKNMIMSLSEDKKFRAFFAQPAGDGWLYLVDDTGYTFRKALFDDGSAGVLIRSTQRYSAAAKFKLIPAA